MRAAAYIAALGVGIALFFAVTGAGADSEDPTADASGKPGPRNQLLGDWRRGRGRYRFTEDDGEVSGRARRPLELGDCRVPRGTVLFRDFEFVRREPSADVWRGRAATAGRGCRLRWVDSTIFVITDLQMREASRRGGETRVHRFKRVRPRTSADDPVLGTWERNGGGVVIERRAGRYVGKAREAFLIANGCTVPAGTVVWRLRPSAPRRYDGRTSTFLPLPDCGAGDPSRSRWRLGDDGEELIREAPDGSLVRYHRVD